MELERLLEKAKKKLADFDMIVDPYDLSFVWVSEKICKMIGLSEAEAMATQMIEIHTGQEEEVRRIESEFSCPFPDKQVKLPIRTKDGKELHINTKASCFEFDGQPYVIGKILE